jgi:hypothetical protein
MNSRDQQHRSSSAYRGVNLQVCRLSILQVSCAAEPGGEAGAVEAAVRFLRTASLGFTLFLLLLLAFTPTSAQAAVSGKLINRTTGKPAGGILVTLLKFETSMDPVEEVRTAADGSFAFEKSLLGPNGGPVPGMVRAEYEGVNYSQMIPPGKPSEGLEVAVYSAEAKQVLAPRGHILIFEPGSGEMVVNENFAFLNNSDPPRTFRDAEKGTLRFYLPPEAKGIVQVRAAGPQRMPLRSVATPAGGKDIYKVDFPLKPGENSIDLTYLVPFTEGAEFESRVLYDGLETRIATPAGVTLEADGLVSLGQEPRTQASIYQLPAAPKFQVKISGQGKLASSGEGGTEAEANSGGGSDIKVVAAPVAKELYWILGLTAAVLTLGFFSLYSKQPDAALAGAAADPAVGKPSVAPRTSAGPSQQRPAAQRKT